MLPIDLNKKNLFHVLTVGNPCENLQEWSLKVCGTLKVSLLHVFVPTKAYLNVLKESPCPSADVGACCVENGVIKRILKSPKILFVSPAKSFQSFQKPINDCCCIKVTKVKPERPCQRCIRLLNALDPEPFSLKERSLKSSKILLESLTESLLKLTNYICTKGRNVSPESLLERSKRLLNALDSEPSFLKLTNVHICTKGPKVSLESLLESSIRLLNVLDSEPSSLSRTATRPKTPQGLKASITLKLKSNCLLKRLIQCHIENRAVKSWARITLNPLDGECANKKNPKRTQKKRNNVLNKDKYLTNYNVQANENHPSFRQTKILVEQRHIRSGDIHSNPGPGERDQDRDRDGPAQRAQPAVTDGGEGTASGKQASIFVTSFNVRGLKEEKKTRHLLSQFNKTIASKNNDVIVCLQETYVENAGKIPYMWRGNYHLTPGIGNSGGCLTLLSSHVNIIASRELENRGHLLVCKRSDDRANTYVIANIYAPNPNSQAKVDFFDNVFETLSELEIT